jgi:hypothetical protein
MLRRVQKLEFGRQKGSGGERLRPRVGIQQELQECAVEELF